ncbi:membrane protein FxsA [Polycladomyces abyssicola]|uniref:Membrane protein FxsA n=1 Tax=Polycladomyces abyssicola TaxID=1125966 RepID=A0A8D5UD51_9BACL|nr:FxsA family protein [Polycladomyces abyssicola]BCU81057.1 membrane protein FxsA [Polycladomyces abyssicola]
MFRWILLALIVVPVLEITGLVAIGNWIGPLPTVVLVLATGLLGAYLARQQGWQTWRLLQIQLRNGEMPGETLLDGLCILMGGVCLVIPGFFSDVIGIFLLTPYTRGIARLWLKRWLLKKFNSRLHWSYRR